MIGIQVVQTASSPRYAGDFLMKAPTNWIAGLMIGIPIGVVIGLLLDSVGAGIGIGIALGIAFALAFKGGNGDD